MNEAFGNEEFCAFPWMQLGSASKLPKLELAILADGTRDHCPLTSSDMFRNHAPETTTVGDVPLVNGSSIVAWSRDEVSAVPAPISYVNFSTPST